MLREDAGGLGGGQEEQAVRSYLRASSSRNRTPDRHALCAAPQGFPCPARRLSSAARRTRRFSRWLETRTVKRRTVIHGVACVARSRPHAFPGGPRLSKNQRSSAIRHRARWPHVRVAPTSGNPFQSSSTKGNTRRSWRPARSAPCSIPTFSLSGRPAFAVTPRRFGSGGKTSTSSAAYSRWSRFGRAA